MPPTGHQRKILYIKADEDRHHLSAQILCGERSGNADFLVRTAQCAAVYRWTVAGILGIGLFTDYSFVFILKVCLKLWQTALNHSSFTKSIQLLGAQSATSDHRNAQTCFYLYHLLASRLNSWPSRQMFLNMWIYNNMLPVLRWLCNMYSYSFKFLLYGMFLIFIFFKCILNGLILRLVPVVILFLH